MSATQQMGVFQQPATFRARIKAVVLRSLYQAVLLRRSVNAFKPVIVGLSVRYISISNFIRLSRSLYRDQRGIDLYCLAALCFQTVQVKAVNICLGCCFPVEDYLAEPGSSAACCKGIPALRESSGTAARHILQSTGAAPAGYNTFHLW